MKLYIWNDFFLKRVKDGGGGVGRILRLHVPYSCMHAQLLNKKLYPLVPAMTSQTWGPVFVFYNRQQLCFGSELYISILKTLQRFEQRPFLNRQEVSIYIYIDTSLSLYLPLMKPQHIFFTFASVM